MFEIAALAARDERCLWHSGAAASSLFQGDARRTSQEAGSGGTVELALQLTFKPRSHEWIKMCAKRAEEVGGLGLQGCAVQSF